MSDQTPQELLHAAAVASISLAAKLRLQAAEQYLERHEFDLAEAALRAISRDNLTPADLTRFNQARAQILIDAGNFLEAKTLLTQQILASALDYQLVAKACAGLNRHSCAADGWIQASLSFSTEKLPADIHDTIWQHLSAARSGPQVFSHRDHHAWWSLQQVIREAGSVPAQLRAWQQWQSQNPSHPASIKPPTALSRLQDYRPPSIAVMLPLSGNLSGAGRAVRDGLAAAYVGEQPATRGIVEFYDTATQPIAHIWAIVLENGHDVVIGPLIKENVQAFAELTASAQLPRLSLNYLSDDDNNPGGLFQLGVAIEDEASSLVTHMLLAGHKRVMIVHSQSQWSQRANSAFAEQWPFPITSGEFVNVKGLTEAVGSAMLTAESEGRKSELERLLGTKLEFLPRAREDLDAIVALTSNVESQALVPALRFHFGDHLPIYSTSQAARLGEVDALKGFKITELPLLAASSYQPLNEAFSVARSNFAELYALGHDAYWVGTWLPLLRFDSKLSVPGASGHLWLDGDGSFRRELELIDLGIR